MENRKVTGDQTIDFKTEGEKGRDPLPLALFLVGSLTRS